jgi:cytochrome o ubiquinol oxidase subunit 1
MFGRLTYHSFIHDKIQGSVVIMMIAAVLLTIILLFHFKRWGWLWREWLTSLDPKKIGMMYMVVVLLMLVKGVADAVMLRLQQLWAVGDSYGYLEIDHFQQIFTAHGTTMIFFVGMGIIFGLMNLVVPLQIGARDVAFPFLNAVSFWLFAAGSMLIIVSMIIGDFSTAGWVAYPPLSGLRYSPGEGVDYWIWAVQISGAGSLLGGLNFLVTIIKMRCPGMTMMKMPLFTWSILGTVVLIIFAFPILTATTAMLALDRLLDMHFFTAEMGGNPMMYVNLIWAWGHPEVYILILPAFGVFSEVVTTFSQKKLFGYVSMVWAIIAITFLSFILWLHHFFTMGAGANVNAFFGVMTMAIAIPTGVKVFNWIFTMYQGRVQFKTPMLWFLGFASTFTIGGMTGVLLAIPPVDYQVHNSLFLIAHFHSVIIGGVVFGFFAGMSLWYPKIMGYKLNERLGKYAFWCWFVGFLAAFMPLYWLGLMGATRRIEHHEANPGWQTLFVVAGIGAAFIVAGIGFQLLQLYVSYRDRKKNLDVTGDPWHGHSLEWSTTSPPPVYNFAIVPHIRSRDPLWTKGYKEELAKKHTYEDIHLPKNTPYGMYIAGFSFLFAFAIVWHMWWLVLLSFAGVIGCLVIHLSKDDTEYTIRAETVKKMEHEAALRSKHT